MGEGLVAVRCRRAAASAVVCEARQHEDTEELAAFEKADADRQCGHGLMRFDKDPCTQLVGQVLSCSGARNA